jgi:FkbM family methyltransferase
MRERENYKSKIYNFFLKIIRKKNIIEFLSKNNIFFIKKLRNLYYKKISLDEKYPYNYFKKKFGKQKNALINIDINDPSHIGQIIDPFWEVKVFDIYNKLKKNIIFIDIGANIGCHTIFFLKYMRCKKAIYIEPNAKCHALFKSSIKLNNLKKCIILNKAVSNNRFVNLKVYSNNSGGGSIVNYFGNKEKSRVYKSNYEQFNNYKVKSISLQDILKKYTNKKDNIIIKIDAQGFETEILKNFLHLNSFLKRNILNVLYEVNDFELNKQKKILNKLKLFYTLKDLDNNKIKISSIKKHLKKIVNLEKI